MNATSSPSGLGGSGISGKHVFVIGPFELQNKLLEGFLSKEAGITCSQSRSLKEYYSGVNVINTDMLLIDCMRNDCQDLINELDYYNENSEGRADGNPYLALFNVLPGAQLERRAVQRGVVGFFYESDSLDLILKGIQMIFEGHLWLPRKVFKRCLTELHNVNGTLQQNSVILTSREHEILTMIAQGASNEDIAGNLCISLHTAKSHTHNIFKKIQVPNRLKAALWARVNL